MHVSFVVETFVAVRMFATTVNLVSFHNACISIWKIIRNLVYAIIALNEMFEHNLSGVRFMCM